MRARWLVVGLWLGIFGQAQGSIRLWGLDDPDIESEDATPFAIQDDSTSQFSAVWEGGDGDSASSPYVVYAPFSGRSAPSLSTEKNEHNFTTVGNSLTSAAVTSYLPIVNLGVATAFIFNPQLLIELEHSFAGDRYFYVAVENKDDEFKLATDASPLTEPNAASARTIQVLWENICQLTDVCNMASSSAAVFEGRTLLYILASDDGTFDVGKGIAPSDFEGGIYVEVNFSNEFEGDEAPFITTLRRGDGRLLLAIDEGINFLDEQRLDETFIVDLADTSFNTSETPTLRQARQQQVVFNGQQLEEKQLEGDVVKKGLTNAQEYQLAVMHVDKYQFATLLSPSRMGTPQEIETFLEKSSCYLLSAGFGGHHPVLRPFRQFRDQVLIPSSWGRRFVNFYYRSAPDWVWPIQQARLLRVAIQGTAMLAAPFVDPRHQ